MVKKKAQDAKSDDRTVTEDNDASTNGPEEGFMELVETDVPDIDENTSDDSSDEIEIITHEDLPSDEPEEKPSESTEGKKVKLKKTDVLARLLEKTEVIRDLDKQNRELQVQVKDTRERYLRAAAEFENYRKRSRKEWDLLKQQSQSEIILEVLAVVDDFERAFSAAGDNDSSEFVQGIQLIYNNLRSALEKFGVTEVQSLGEPFDPQFHMAVGQIESEDTDSGNVCEVVQKGYRLDQTVIRPARVIVAK